MDNYNVTGQMDPTLNQSKDSDAAIKRDMQAKRDMQRNLDNMAGVAQAQSGTVRVDVGETKCASGAPDPSQALVQSLQERRNNYIREAHNLESHARSNWQMAEKLDSVINLLTLSPHKAILTEMLELLKSGVV